jgi:hypothetical protein
MRPFEVSAIWRKAPGAALIDDTSRPARSTHDNDACGRCWRGR